MAFLKSKFGSRVISRTAEIEWPSHSPDLNPLDFSIWGIMEEHVNHIKPRNKIELMECLNEFASEMDPEMLKRIEMNIRKRAKLCLDQNGGHFEHLLKLINKRNKLHCVNVKNAIFFL